MKNRVRAIASFCLIFSIFSLLAFVPRDEDPLSKLVSNLQKWTDTIPQEKIYLHTDKPYYALGDTIWFKGYLTIGSRHQLSALSGAVYVDLINQNDSLVQQLKLPVTSGMVMGNFILKDDYRQGSYRLRAYTQWMRNAGEDYFYDHTFLVGDVAGGNFTAKADFKYRTEKDYAHLQVIINYTNDAGHALADQSLRYEIRRKNKAIWQQNSKTDASGNLAVDIPKEVTQNPEGTYIRTYIKDGKNTIIREFPIKAGLSQSDVQFFPESGNLVNGLSSHVAFKAVGIDGLGINIQGTVTDNDNKEVAKIETLHAGMGSFLLRPQAGKTYTANIKFDDGSTKAIPLPQVIEQGYVLSVYQSNQDSVLVRVQASAFLIQSPVNIIAHTGGEIILSSPLKIEKPITSIWLNKKSFPTGIAQFTLFDVAGQPLNERIAFIRTHDQMSLDIKTSKTTYGSKERVLAQLDAKNAKGQPAFGNFSVSVIDESKVPFDENKESTIFSNLLLTADLKGYVEEPNYYFAQSGDQVDKALDNLMLTQGYRRFSWKALSNTVTIKPKYGVEGWGSSISGAVTTLGHKVLAGAKVDLVSIRARVAKNTTTDAQGRFSFDDLFITDSIKITIQARNPSKTGFSDKAILTLDTLPRIKVNTNKNLADVSTNIGGALKSYIEASKKEDDLYEKMGLLDKVHRLREINIIAKKKVTADADITPQGMFKINEQSADQLINVDPEEASHYVSLAAYLQARMQGVRVETGRYGSYLDLLQSNSTFRSSFRNAKQPITLYIDGRRIDQPDAVAEALDGSYDPQDIAKIEVVHSNQAIINFLGGPAVLILTKLGTGRKAGYTPNIANITPKGFNRVREFYVPRYDRLGADLTQPDLRSTVFWSPYLKTDETGRTVFNFFAGDGPGTYKVVIEGINADGQLGRKVYHFTVDANKDFIAAQNAAITKQVNTSAIETALNSFNKRMPTEKIYLHLDRAYYNLNDTLWFKAYVVNGSTLTPSKQSGLMYVEMDDDSTSVVRQISVRVKDGGAWGQIPMPVKLFHEGAYTLRAYTNWMQNQGPASFYTKRLYLGKADEGSWLLNAKANLSKDEKQHDMLNINLKLNKIDKLSSPVALKPVQVTLYEIRDELSDFQRWIYREKLQTGIDGSLKFSTKLEQKLNGNRLRIRIKSLSGTDKDREIQTPVSILRNQNIDLQFLPEGGNLVAGLKSVVGFKAIGEDGLSTSVRGDIYTTSGTKVLSFATLHNGMGSFELTPQPGEAYIARLTEPAGKPYKLPAVNAQGVVLHVDNPEEGDNINISVSGLKLSADTAYYLLGSTRGLVHYTHRINAGETEFTIPKNSFPTGIARFTLFKGLRPANARMIFIDHHDQFNFSIRTNKETYKTRDSVGLMVEVKDKSGIPVQGNFSLAVTDDSQVMPDTLNNYGIAAGLLINSELKGRVESPGYYISRKDKYAWKALDNLMLTQGWVGYDWSDIFAPPTAPKFEAEDQLTVKGSVKMLFGNAPSTGTQVLLSSQKPQFLLSTFTDANGNFEFKSLPVIDSGAFFAQVNNPKGKPMVSADLRIAKFIPPKVFPTDNDPVLPWYVNGDTTQINKAKHIIENQPIDFDPKGTLLKEVQIRKSKIIKNSYYTGPTNLTFDEEDIRKSAQTNLYDVLKQQVHGFRVIFEIRDPFHRNMTIPKIGDDDFVDELWVDANALINHHPVQKQSGVIMDRDRQHGSVESMINMLRSYPIAQLKGIQVVLSRSVPMLPYARDYYWAKIFVTTKEGLGSFYSRNKPGTDTYRPMPVVNPDKFYSPKYAANDNTSQADDRPTLYWEPNVVTDMNGRAKLSFYTSDIKGKYTVKIAGIDNQGGIGDGSYKINEIGTSKSTETKKAALKSTDDLEKNSSSGSVSNAE